MRHGKCILQVTTVVDLHLSRMLPLLLLLQCMYLYTTRQTSPKIETIAVMGVYKHCERSAARV
jgi:hypothetical protein